MNRRIDFNQLGGFPISQNSLAFLQQSFRDAFAGLAAYFGDYVILSGVADLGANYGDGWMAINGELVPFVGGTKASNVVITESVASKLFADGNTKNVWYTRTASCASSGGTPFTSFTRLSGAKNDQLNLTAEVNARTNGDTTLQTNINNEIAARANGDTTLQTNINNEIAARANGDSTLQTNINALQTNKADKVQSAWSNITLLNGTSGQNRTPGYLIDSFGKVNLRGQLWWGGASPTNSIIGNGLPTVYADIELSADGFDGTNRRALSILISSSGVLSIASPLSVYRSISLDGISYWR